MAHPRDLGNRAHRTHAGRSRRNRSHREELPCPGSRPAYAPVTMKQKDALACRCDENVTWDLPDPRSVGVVSELMAALPQVALAGQISAAEGLLEIIAFITTRQWSGVLHVAHDQWFRELRIRDGHILAATSNDPREQRSHLQSILFAMVELKAGTYWFARTGCMEREDELPMLALSTEQLLLNAAWHLEDTLNARRPAAFEGRSIAV